MRLLRLMVFAAFVFEPTLAAAQQQQATIAGLVKDSSGGVLPGVTVEAASPALIEKTRTVVTDGTGQYQIVDLRPGTYTVTFTLTGFNTFKRQGIELSGSFAATVNAELKVGAVEETITVTGETPIVDLQSVKGQRVLSQDVIDSVPSPRNAVGLAVLIPGISTTNTGGGGGAGGQDVGGSLGDVMSKLVIHGGKTNEYRMNLDGVPATNSSSNGADTSFEPNLSGVQEITVDTSGASAEQQSGAVRINLVPRDGGNTFKGTFFITGANTSIQGDNFTQDLKDRGLVVPNRLRYMYDINPGAGGPIIKDTLWFYAAWRRNAAHNYVGSFANLNAYDPTRWDYVADKSHENTYSQDYRVANGRLTWQASARNKIALTYDDQGRCQCPSTSATSTDQSARYFMVPLNRTASLTWSSPVTSRLLIEGAIGHRDERWRQNMPREIDPTWNYIGVNDQGLGITYRGKQNNIGFADVLYPLVNPRFSVTYVTGAHAFKAGYNQLLDWEDRYIGGPNSQMLTYQFGTDHKPNQVTEYAYPLDYQWYGNNLGLFVQDKWTINKWTINAGLRYDYFHNYYPETTAGPALLAPNRNVTFPRTEWQTFKDFTPRFGVAYDLFGNGKTAVKATVNKYIAVFTGQGAYTNANPVTLLSSQVTRSWNDRNSNYVVDCDLRNPLSQTVAGGDICGIMSDTNFGAATRTTAIDPEVLTHRPYDWEFSASVQHELTPRVALNVGYFRRIYGVFTVTDNIAVAPSDYTAYSINAPANAGLPNGGGYTVSGLYDLNATRADGTNLVGLINNVQYLTDGYGKQIDHWNGVDASVNARLQRGLLLQGGVSVGRTSTDNCEILAKVPEASPLATSTPYCHVDTPFQPNVKLLGAYTVPKVDVQVGATFQSLPGPQVVANYVVTPNLTTLNRNFTGSSNKSVNIIAPGTFYGERLNQLDLRFAKILKWNQLRSTVNMDLYNALNGNAVIAENANYLQYRTPTTILSARLFRVSLQLDF